MKSKNKKGIVIIGASVAAVSAVEAIRGVKSRVPVTVISAEAGFCYSRPLISHIGLKKEQFYYRDAKFFKKYKVDSITDEAVSIDGGSITLKSGNRIEYSKLILATGGVPVIPPVKGIKGRNVFSFTTYSDACRIREYSKNKKNAVVIGAGMIGIKAAEYLLALGMDVTMVELMDRPFAAVLDERSGRIVADEIKKHVKLFLKSGVVEIKENYCLLKGGKKIKSDVVICAVGVVPNVKLAAEAGIKVNRGIIVDAAMATSMENVYAAGDCAESLDILSGENRPLPIWPVAHKQGEIAGLNAAGVSARYEGGFIMNSVDIFGYPMITLGMSSAAGDDSVAAFDENKNKYKKIVIRDGKIIGVILLGDINRAGIFTGIIKDRLDVSNFKNDLLKDNFGYIYVPKEEMSSEVLPIEI